MENKKYYLGFDIGTDSLGYAATDSAYALMKFKGEPVWGTVLFDEAQLNTDRRMHRTARRRLDRRKQRVQLVQELFAHEIAKVDVNFYKRMQESRLLRDEAQSSCTLFEDAGMTDRDYNAAYPTVHHLICDLMESDAPHDVRLVYLACAWLVAHRGHFLSEISRENLESITSFETVWGDLEEYLRRSSDSDADLPWTRERGLNAANALKGKAGVTAKYKRLCEAVFEGGKPPKQPDGFAFSFEAMFKALCCGKIKASDLFQNEEYKEVPSFTLGDADDKLAEILGSLGDDAELIIKLKAVFDWALLIDLLGDSASLSAAKVRTYDRHKEDLKLLKEMIRKYKPEQYRPLFIENGAVSYAAYSGHFDPRQKGEMKRCNKTDFSDALRKQLQGVQIDDADRARFDDMMERLSLYTFLPKQRDGDNRVIPHQMYWHELDVLLRKASSYLPFLQEKDENGWTVADKLRSVFTYRIPYYVGPLNRHSEHAWIVRKAEGRILPWNFDEVVDRDMCEKCFIDRMTNTCTYLPDQPVLPRESLLYHRFTVLNEINKLKIDGVAIPVEVKQAIYRGVFEQQRKVTPKRIRDYLLSNGYMTANQTLSGVDIAIHADLKSYHDFKRLLASGTLTEAQAERIIEHKTYTEDAARLKRWLAAEFPTLEKKDAEYIARLNYKDFGRLSAAFLTELEGVDNRIGEVMTVMQALWETNCNLMELLSDQYTFAERVEEARRTYYAEKKLTLDQRLTEMRLSNAVKRPVLRTIEVAKEVTKAMQCPPSKIFIEMTRGATEDQKNKRTRSRRQQLEELYAQCRDEDVREMAEQLEQMGDAADTLLQSDRLFLYYVQLGRCMYSGAEIDLNLLAGSTYNIEHIYPRSYVKDDSIINNEVLVLSELNGQKSDTYPIDDKIRAKMTPFWSKLKRIGLLSDEKYKRLTRNTPFTDDEQMGFINRQLTETSQSTKAVASILKELYPDAEIVYVKARLASEFRQAFDLLKSRAFNDLHHAKDAYLNIVTGNVYSMRFSKRWFNLREGYNVKPETLYTHPVRCGGETVWEGSPALERVKKTVAKNTAHLTRYAFCKHGKFFDVTINKAKENLIPIKAGLPTEKYGGYNSAGAAFFVPVRYVKGKKREVMLMTVDLMNAEKFKADAAFAQDYVKARLEGMLRKRVDAIDFPLGKRIIRINTILSLDGLRVCIAGNASRGKAIITSLLMPFSAPHEYELYLKRLESLAEKVKKNPKYVYSERYDKVSPEMNLRLYDLYVDKLQNSIYAKRLNNPLEALKQGREQFLTLSPVNQAKALLNIHMIFGRVSSGVDLTAIGGDKTAASTKALSTSISNWKKNYKDVRLIDTSASGIWEKASGNLLELL